MGSSGENTAGGVGFRAALRGDVSEASGRLVAATAWLFVLLGTNVPRIVATEAFGVDPPWLGPAQMLAVGGLLALTVLDDRFRALQSFALVLLAVNFVTAEPVGDVLGPLVVAAGERWAFLVSFLFKAGVALVVAGVLLARGDDRSALFLERGDLSATATGERIPLVGAGRSWWVHGTLTGGAVVGTLAAVLALGGGNFAVDAGSVAGLLGAAVVVVVGASANAFAEEFLFRAAPLADLSEVLAKNHAMVLLGALFGLSHYYGAPGGVPGVLMTFFLGWWLTKSLLETRGIAVAWTVHVLLDVLILLVLLEP